MSHDPFSAAAARLSKNLNGRALPSPRAAPYEPEPVRMRKLVLTSQYYHDVVAGKDSFLVRPIMNILGRDLRPVSTRARAQGGAGGLLWAFFDGNIIADAHLLRSCPYGDPGDQLMIVTPDHNDQPLTVTVLESYPHRVLATTDKFLQGLQPSQWARLGSVRNFLEHWEHSFGRVFRLAHEPWAWIVRFGSLANLADDTPPEPGPPPKTGLFWRWRRRRDEKPQGPAPDAVQVPTASDRDRELLAAQRNAIACLENAIKARRKGQADESWRMMNVAYRILSRAAKAQD
jgi:hypothetical protein